MTASTNKPVKKITFLKTTRKPLESVDLRQGSLPPENAVYGRIYEGVLFFLSIYFAKHTKHHQHQN